MITTSMRIQGVPSDKIQAIHELFRSEGVRSEILSAKDFAAMPGKIFEWWDVDVTMNPESTFPFAKLVSSQWNQKFETYTIEIVIAMQITGFNLQAKNWKNVSLTCPTTIIERINDAVGICKEHEEFEMPEA